MYSNTLGDNVEWSPSHVPSDQFHGCLHSHLAAKNNFIILKDIEIRFAHASFHGLSCYVLKEVLAGNLPEIDLGDFAVHLRNVSFCGVNCLQYGVICSGWVLTMMVRDLATVRFSNVVFCGGRGMCGTEFSTNTIRVQQCTAAFQFDARFRLIIE